MRDRRSNNAGIVRYFCPCGFIVSARSAYAALENLRDHNEVCTLNPPTTTGEKNNAAD